MTPLAMLGYALILVIIVWVVYTIIFVGISSFGPYEGRVLKAMAGFGVVLFGIISASAVNSLMLKK